VQVGLGCVVVLENNPDGGVYLCLTIYGDALDGAGPREFLPASRAACDWLDGSDPSCWEQTIWKL
jgi:hypothetical protein